MAYYLDFSSLGFEYLKNRLNEEDLIPSHLALREDLDARLASLRGLGIATLADLETALSSEAKSVAVADRTGISVDYLKLLRRAVRAYKPRPALLADYPGINQKEVKKLETQGLTTSDVFWEAARRFRDRAIISAKAGIPEGTLFNIASLCDLSRIQWVSPLFARLIHDAGYKSVGDVALATAEELEAGIAAVNREKNLYKGKIGKRDMGRLVYLAGLLPHELEKR